MSDDVAGTSAANPVMDPVPGRRRGAHSERTGGHPHYSLGVLQVLQRPPISPKSKYQSGVHAIRSRNKQGPLPTLVIVQTPVQALSGEHAVLLVLYDSSGCVCAAFRHVTCRS